MINIYVTRNKRERYLGLAFRDASWCDVPSSAHAVSYAVAGLYNNPKLVRETRMSHDEAHPSCSRTNEEQPCCSGGVVQHWTKTPKVMLEKMHRHCNAVTVSATLPSRHSVRMATDNITVGTTEVNHIIYYIHRCRDTRCCGSLALTAHIMRHATHITHTVRGHRAGGRWGW